MTSFLRKILLASTVILMPLCAKAVYLNPEKVLRLSIAKTGLTRLSVKKDKIQDIFVYPVEASNNVQLHKSGHLFLTPEGLQGPLSVTLITEVGHTQDLRLKFVAKNASPIYLEERTPLPAPVSLQVPYQSSEQLLSDFVFKGKSPGFEKKPGTGEQRQVQGITYRCVRSWVNNSYRVLFFETSPQGEGYEIPLSLAKRPGDIVLAPGLPKKTPSFYVLQSHK